MSSADFQTPGSPDLSTTAAVIFVTGCYSPINQNYHSGSHTPGAFFWAPRTKHLWIFKSLKAGKKLKLIETVSKPTGRCSRIYYLRFNPKAIQPDNEMHEVVAAQDHPSPKGTSTRIADIKMNNSWMSNSIEVDQESIFFDSGDVRETSQNMETILFRQVYLANEKVKIPRSDLRTNRQSKNPNSIDAIISYS